MPLNITGGALEFDAIINDSQFGNKIRGMELRLQGLAESARKESASMEQFAQKASLAIGSYLSVTAVSNFVTDIARVRGEFQQLEVAFSTMLGSKEKANKLMAEVTEFAATTPFELSNTAAATKQLLAFGIAADDIIGTLRSLGDVAAGISAPIGDIAYLYGTIKTAGVANSVDIKQFAQRGIPIYEELAKVLKTNVEGVKDFVTAGKVGFPEIQRVFQSMTAEGSRFGGLMDAQSKTITGQISNFQDAYARMLNDMGKSSEGVFFGAIRGATSLVENYQKVLDIIKVLVITYGSYRAAIITTNAVQAISISLTKGYTIAETLRYQAMLLSERAMKLLNITMLSNPAVAIATGIAALIATLVIFSKETTRVKSATELLADAQKDMGDSIAGSEAKIRPYVEALKNANITEKDRLSIYNKLNEIDPKIVAGLNAKTLAYDNLKKNVDKYLESLRNQIRLEANESALKASIKQEQEIESLIKREEERNARREKIANASPKSTKEGGIFTPGKIAEDGKATVRTLKDQLKQQQSVSTELGKTVKATTIGEGDKQAAVKRTVTVIQEEIKALKERQAAAASNRQEYISFQNQIIAKEKELEAITGRQAAKDATSNVKEVNQRQDQLRSLNEAIYDAEREALRSGLVKEESEIDRINAKFDDLKRKAGELKAGTGVIQRIEKARDLQVDNTKQKDAAREYEKVINQQREVYNRFEEYKIEVGVQKARELIGKQVSEFDSYINFLKTELEKLKTDKSIGGQIKFDFITDQLGKAEREAEFRKIEQQKEDYKNLIQATLTYQDQRLAIIKHYKKLESDLEKESHKDDYAERKKLLEANKRDDLEVLENHIIRQSLLYKKLGTDIIGFSKAQIQVLITELQTALSSGKFTDTAGRTQFISPEFRKQIEGYIDQLQKAIGLSKSLQKAAILEATGAGLNQIANQLSGVNEELAQMVRNIANVSGSLGVTIRAFKEFSRISKANNEAKAAGQKGDTIGQITAGLGIVGAAIGVVTAIVGIFKKAKEERQQAKREAEEFQRTVYAGEQEINLLYRERAREQAKINTDRIGGIQAEIALLEKQRTANDEQAKSTLDRLQITGKYKPIDRALTRQEIFAGGASLIGKSYEELERLFTTGQLDDKAKALFETLRKLHEEGVNINRFIEESNRRLKEQATGATEQGIIDSIADGFRNGLRSAEDFAGSFEEMMRNAVINALKYKYLSEPLKAFYEQFAAASQSDNVLTAAEISELKTFYDDIVRKARVQFDQLQQFSGLNFSNAVAGGGGLSGAIQGIRADQADLLAGRLGGMQVSLRDQLEVAMQALRIHQQIEANTALTAIRLSTLLSKFDNYETGARKLHIN